MSNKKCPICDSNLENGGTIYTCPECNRYYVQEVINLPRKMSSSFYDLPMNDQIIIAKEQAKHGGK